MKEVNRQTCLPPCEECTGSLLPMESAASVGRGTAGLLSIITTPPPFCGTTPNPSGELAPCDGRLGNLSTGEDGISPPDIGAGDRFGAAAGTTEFFRGNTTLIAHF